MTWRLGLAWVAGAMGTDLQTAARRIGGGRALWGAGRGGLERAFRGDDARIDRFTQARAGFDPETATRSLTNLGAWFAGAGADGFPAALLDLPDAPFGLFGIGESLPAREAGGQPVIAIVGSRRGTGAGRVFARDLAAGLAARGAVIVSGLALGIDAAAHEGALAAGGPTVAVLGCGVDVIHPKTNRRLRERILAEGGAIVSEYWPGTEPAPWRFPARNRIVAGLADAVVVVEAAERSGALITADFALELGRPVLAVPGPAGSTAVAGGHALLRSGAAFCEGPDDVVAEVLERDWRAGAMSELPELAGLEAQVHRELRREPLRLDELTERLEVPAPDVAAALGRLELAACIVRGDGQRYWAAPLRGAAA